MSKCDSPREYNRMSQSCGTQVACYSVTDHLTMFASRLRKTYCMQAEGAFALLWHGKIGGRRSLEHLLALLGNHIACVESACTN